jgi:5-methylcytosine-specific restriction endonuclease McrA
MRFKPLRRAAACAAVLAAGAASAHHGFGNFDRSREVKLEAEARYEVRTRRRIKPEIRAIVLERDGHACVLCDAKEDLTLDHIFPHVEGGSDDPVNLRVLCRSCNSSKGASIPDAIRLMGREG